MTLQLSKNDKKQLYHDIGKLLVVTLFINMYKSFTSTTELFNDKTINNILQGSLGLIIFYLFFNKYISQLANN
jgi:hypothetical protein